MEIESSSDGRMRFLLGPGERWIVALVGTGFVALLVAGYSDMKAELAGQSKATNVLVTQNAVMSDRISELTKQLADVPRMTSQIAELKVRVDRHEEDIKELRKIK